MKRKTAILLCMTMIACGCLSCGQNKPVADATEEAQEESAPGDVQEMTGEADDSEDAQDGSTEAQEATGSDQSDDSEGEDDAGAAESDPEDTPKLSETVTSSRDMFADFIMGKGEATAADDLLWAMGMVDQDVKSGDTFTVSELEGKIEENEVFDGTDRKVAYAPLMCHGELFHVLKILYKREYEEFTDYFIFVQHSDKLEMKFAIDSWTRRCVTINEEGVVFDDGSNGAGSHSSVIYAPDKNVTYHTVSDVEEQYYGYSFFDEDGKPIQDLNDTMQEAGERNEKAQTVAYYREIIDGKVYYYFLGGTEKITQSTVEYIDEIAATHDFKFDGKAAADEARKAYEEKLDIVSEVDSQSEPYWKDL